MNELELRAELDNFTPDFAAEPAEWPDVLRRVAARRPRRRRMLIAAVVVALLAAPVAFALGSKLVDLFEGTPATPAVQAHYIVFNGSLTDAIRSKFAVQPVDVSQAHGVIAIQTSEGPVYLWSAPEQGGGACFFVQYANELPANDNRSGAGGCSPATAPTSKTIYPGTYWTGTHPSLRILFGYTYADATGVEVDLSDGSTVRLPVTEQYFLTAIDANTQISRITSYDAHGTQVGDATLTTGG